MVSGGEEKRMREEKKIRIRWFHCIGYLFLLLSVLFLYFFLRSYFLLVILFLLVVWPVVSVTGLWYLVRGVRGEMGTGQESTRPGDTVLLTFQLQNRSWWLALEAEWRVRFENTLWEERSEQYVSMPVRPHGNESLTLPLQITNLGHFHISSDTLLLQDILGLVRFRIPLALTKEIDVIPADGQQTPHRTEGYMSGLSETEESREKGNDFAEVSDIREYAPGDRIRDIHWKLSAAKDILMVKERVAVAGSEMALMLQPGIEKEPAEQVLTQAFHLAQAFLEGQVPVCLILWNQHRYDWEENRFASREELEEVFCNIYHTPVSLRNNDEWERYMANCYPFLNHYLMIGVQEGEVQVVLHENA